MTYWTVLAQVKIVDMNSFVIRRYVANEAAAQVAVLYEHLASIGAMSHRVVRLKANARVLLPMRHCFVHQSTHLSSCFRTHKHTHARTQKKTSKC